MPARLLSWMYRAARFATSPDSLRPHQLRIELRSGSHASRFVDLLQAPDADGIALTRDYGLSGCLGSAERGGAWNPGRTRGAADVTLVLEGVAAGGGIDDQLQRAGLHDVDGVRPSLVHLE